jgi:hypothetical protein
MVFLDHFYVFYILVWVKVIVLGLVAVPAVSEVILCLSSCSISILKTVRIAVFSFLG